MTPSSARALRRRRVAELRAAEPDLSLRQMAERLDISRDTVTRDLAEIDRDAAESAPPAGQPEPVAEAPSAGDAAASAPVADPAPQVSVGGRTDGAMPGKALAAPVAHDQPPAVVAATDGQERRPVAEPRLPRRIPVDSRLTLDMDLSAQHALRRAIADLSVTELSLEQLVGQALVVLALAYRQGVAAQRISPQGRFTVLDARAVPSQPGVAVPRRPAAPVEGA